MSERDGCLEWGEEWDEEPDLKGWHVAVIVGLFALAVILPLVVIL